MKNNVESGSVKKIFSSHCYELPKYQRDYSWTKDEVSDLTSDLDYLLEVGSSAEHYMDNIITYSGKNRHKIVDGQQRITTLMILFSSIREKSIEIKEKLKEQNESVAVDKMEAVITACDSMIDDVDGFNGYTYYPNDYQKEVYFEIMKQNSNVSEYDCSNVSEKNMKNAKIELDSWVDKKFKEHWEEVGEDSEKFANMIDSIVSDIRQNITFTLYIVEDKLEANRMFEIVNDRGREVNDADKIKSYLTYYVSLQDRSDLVEEIEVVFNDLQSEIAGTDEKKSDIRINRFIQEHWRLFSGVTQDTDVHESIKKQLERDGDNVTRSIRLIQNYLNSLEMIMPYFKYMMRDVDILLNETDNKAITDNKENLYVIREFGPTQSTLPYILVLLSLYDTVPESNRESILDKTRTAIAKVRSLVILSHNLLEHYNDYGRSLLREYSADIEWSRKEASPVGMFMDTNEHRTKNNTISESLSESISKLEDKISEENMESQIKSTNDLLEGDAGSSGVDKNLVKYILFKYEIEKQPHLPEMDISYFDKNTSNIFTLEHILPQELDLKNYELSDYNITDMDEHQLLKNNLGNLAILSLQNNLSGSNKPFKEKTKVYSKDDATNMLNEVSVDYDTWGRSQITDRQNKLIEYILEKWV